VGLVWRAKDDLPLRKRIYYGKALKKTPTMISLECFPMFYATKGYSSGVDPLGPFSLSRMSQSARRIMEILSDSPPMPTKELKIASGHSSPDRRYRFDSAMAELQERLLVMKIAEEYDPFTFIWGRVDRWLVREVEKSGEYDSAEARRLVLEKYFSTVIAATEKQVCNLFGWKAKEVSRAIGELLDHGVLSDGVRMVDDGRRCYIHSEYL
jgi:hypothetical protein